jgi:hypothetical protein
MSGPRIIRAQLAEGLPPAGIFLLSGRGSFSQSGIGSTEVKYPPRSVAIGQLSGACE